MKKRVGLLTFHYGHNYGAVLQCFALLAFLKKQGYDPVVIDYRNSAIEKTCPKRLKLSVSIRDCCHPFRKLADALAMQRQWTTRYEKFERFTSSFLPQVPCSLLNENNGYFYAVIAGSDQIWNKRMTEGMDAMYLLAFPSSAIRIFYGASNGKTSFDDSDLPLLREALLPPAHVSTREAGLADFILSHLNISAIPVVDPSFLLSKDDYIRLFNLSKHEGNRFLFAYYVVEDVRMQEFVAIIAHTLGLDIIELHPFKTRSLPFNYQRADFGPLEFLEHIFKSEFVITNSFHGIAFSIVFEKQFYGFYDSDVRKDSLLRSLGLESRHIAKPSDLNLEVPVDYSRIDLSHFAEPSKRFLEESLVDGRDY